MHDDDADADAVDAATPDTRCSTPVKAATTRRSPSGTGNRTPTPRFAVSTASGREEAMHVVHEVAESPKHEVAPAVEALDDPEASG